MAGEGKTSEEGGYRKYLKRAGEWMDYNDKAEWLKEMRGSLSMTASIIATMTFQLATNPPGGVLQASYTDNVTKTTCSNSSQSRSPGEAVVGIVYQDTYIRFLVFNTISFVASLSVCLLLVSGIPLNHTFPIWLLSPGMCITITSLALTYLYAASMVTPSAIWPGAIITFGIALLVWVGLIGFVGVFLILRLIVRGVNKCPSNSVQLPHSLRLLLFRNNHV